MITRAGDTLFIYLREIAASATQELIDAGLYDPVKEGPDVEKIEALVRPFLESGEHTRLPDEKLAWIIENRAVQAGTAFQALGNLDIAALWYRIGQYGWRGKAHWYEGNVLDLDWTKREGPAQGQEDPAICAALANTIPRARQLFEWISQNRYKTDQEIRFYEEARGYNQIWESIGFQLFALAWLGEQWLECSRLAEIGRRAIEKTRKAGYPRDFREPQLLVEIGGCLSAYFLDLNPRNKELAMNSLRLDKMRDRENKTRANMLRYFFALGQRYPEVNPYPEKDFHLRLWRPSSIQRDTPLTRREIQNELDELFKQAERQKKVSARVSSTGLHLSLGGYPGTQHQLSMCSEVMRENLKAGGKITGQSYTPDEGWLEIYYSIPRSG